jgi:proteasome accessory factor B
LFNVFNIGKLVYCENKIYNKTPIAQLATAFRKNDKNSSIYRRWRISNATKLSTEFEVSTKSIYRDIEFMRDRMELPIEFDHIKNGYYYTEPVENFPAIQMTEGEFFALLVAEKALQQYRGTNFEKPLFSAFKKMAAALPETISLQISDWEQAISFQLRQMPIINLQTFDTLASAVASKNNLKYCIKNPEILLPNKESLTISSCEHKRRMVSICL